MVLCLWKACQGTLRCSGCPDRILTLYQYSASNHMKFSNFKISTELCLEQGKQYLIYSLEACAPYVTENMLLDLLNSNKPGVLFMGHRQTV